MAKAERFGKWKLYKEWLCVKCCSVSDYYRGKPKNCETCRRIAREPIPLPTETTKER